MLWACLTVSLVTQCCLHSCSATAGCGYPSTGGLWEIFRVHWGVLRSPEMLSVKWEVDMNSMVTLIFLEASPFQDWEGKGWESSHDTCQPHPSGFCILQLLLP